MKTIFHWDDSNKIFTTTMYYKGKQFIGVSKCHPDDMDYVSEKSGGYISELRAEKKVLQHIKENEIKPELILLTHLINNAKRSKHHNKDSYEFKLLLSQKKAKEVELKTIIKDLEEIQHNLKTYIDSKDKIYKRLRERSKEIKAFNETSL